MLKKMFFVISKMAADVEYVEFLTVNDNGQIHHRRGRSVTVKGGQGVRGKNLVTPENGVITEIDDDNFLEVLENNKLFQLHRKNGFVQIIKSDDRRTVQAAADATEKEDNSAQLTAADFEETAEQLGKITNSGSIKVGGEEVKATGKAKKSRKRK